MSALSAFTWTGFWIGVGTTFAVSTIIVAFVLWRGFRVYARESDDEGVPQIGSNWGNEA